MRFLPGFTPDEENAGCLFLMESLQRMEEGGVDRMPDVHDVVPYGGTETIDNIRNFCKTFKNFQRI